MSGREAARALRRKRAIHVVTVANGHSMRPDLTYKTANLRRASARQERYEREGLPVRATTVFPS